MERKDMYVGKMVSSFGRHPEWFDAGKIEYIGMDYIIVRVTEGIYPFYPLLIPDIEFDGLEYGTLNDVKERGVDKACQR